MRLTTTEAIHHVKSLHAVLGTGAVLPTAAIPEGNRLQEWQRLQDLQREHKDLSERLASIKNEVESIFSGLHQFVPIEMRLPEMRHKVEKPRPVEDKLSIAAGRAIVRAMKLRMNPTQCREEGMRAAVKLAKKYKIELPASIPTLIEKKIKDRFPHM